MEEAAMRIHNLYCDASGQSHFRDIEVEWVEETRAGKLSKRLPATGIISMRIGRCKQRVVISGLPAGDGHGPVCLQSLRGVDNGG